MKDHSARDTRTPLWTPSQARIAETNLWHFTEWLRTRDQEFPDYTSLWQWSVTDLAGFWESVWHYFGVISATPYRTVVEGHMMPGIRWFSGTTLNYAEHVFRRRRGSEPALLFQTEWSGLGEWSWDTLEAQVGALSRTFRRLGVRPGDRVAAYLPNIPQTVAAFLATASIGAVWSSCSPDFGSVSVLDRIGQIRPKVLLVTDGYQYGGHVYDRRATALTVAQALPDLAATIFVPHVFPDEAMPSFPQGMSWNDAVARPESPAFIRVPFDHPLWILYSSGTTGIPKAIVHGHGGMLLHHLVNSAFHMDLHPDDRFFWFTTTGWMMWNIVVSGLLQGSTSVLYEGNPGYPNFNQLWRFAADTRMTVFGTSAAFLHNCMKAQVEPGRDCDLSALKTIGSTGSPLTPEAFQWVYDHVKSDVWLTSASGGTDVCNPFVGGVPTLAVYAGEIQSRALGASVEAYDETGQSVVDEVGELVITQPMPSMPLYFWNDTDGRRYHASYFDMYPGIWRHGDWIRITPTGAVIIYGRSDSTINRYGVRMGSSEIYRVVETLPEIQDCLVVDLEALGRQSFMPLFVQLKAGLSLDHNLEQRIRDTLRSQLSPRHVPDAIYAIADIPKTLNGKKLEVPVKKILMGVPVDQAVHPGTMQNPSALDPLIALAKSWNRPSRDVSP